jgi:hypothetical protein
VTFAIVKEHVRCEINSKCESINKIRIAIFKREIIYYDFSTYTLPTCKSLLFHSDYRLKAVTVSSVVMDLLSHSRMFSRYPGSKGVQPGLPSSLKREKTHWCQIPSKKAVWKDLDVAWVVFFSNYSHSGGGVNWDILPVHKSVSCCHGETFPIGQAQQRILQWPFIVDDDGDRVYIVRNFCTLRLTFCSNLPNNGFCPFLRPIVLYQLLLFMAMPLLGRQRRSTVPPYVKIIPW